MSRFARRAVCLFVPLVLLVAGCGDGGDDEEADESSSVDGAFDDALSIVLLAETSGESPAAVPFLADAAELAIEDLNADGGVGGVDVEYERISAPLEGSAAESAVLEAIGEEPSAMLGLVSTGQVLAAAQRVGEAQIPFLYAATAGEVLAGSGSVANDYGFLIRPPQDQIAAAQARFVAEDLGIESIGLVCVNNPFGSTGCDIAERAAEEYGAEIVARETVAQDATNFSGTVIELESAGAEAVVSFVFPTAVGSLHNALSDNGLDVPHMSGSSSLIAFTGAITSGNFDNLYGLDDCAPVADERPDVQDFVARYEERFGYAPTYLSAETYDGIMMIAEAARQAESSDPQAIRDELVGIEYEGICDTYRGEPSQGLHHQLVAVSFGGETLSVEETYELDDYGS